MTSDSQQGSSASGEPMEEEVTPSAEVRPADRVVAAELLPEPEQVAADGPLSDPEAMWPPRITSLVILIGAVSSIVVQTVDVTGDRAVSNILALIGMAVAIGTLLTWAVRNPVFSRTWRRGLLGTAVVLLLLAVAVVRVDQVTGDMVPSFRFVWTPPRDARLTGNLVPEDAIGIDLITTGPGDFPQFLGPQRTGIVESIDLESDWQGFTPRLIWKQPIGAGWSGFAAVNGYAITLEQRGDEEWVTCYLAATGDLQWGHRVKTRHETTLGGVGPRSTPTIHEGRVYALGATGILRCLNGADGSLIWSKDLLAEFGVSPGQDQAAVEWGRAASPLVVDTLVVVPAGGPRSNPVSLVAYDQMTGDEVWRAGSTQISYSSPVVAELEGVRQIVVVNEDRVSGHALERGEILWTFPWPGSSTGAANTSQPLVIRGSEGDSLLVTKGYNQGAARFRLRHDAQSDQWETIKVFESAQVLKTKLTSAVHRDDYAIGISDGILECIDLRDGKRLWKRGRYGHGQVLMVGDHLLVLAETGELALVEASADEHRELHQLAVLSGKTWNTLCLHGDLLLIRNGEEAACYQLAIRGSLR